MKSEKKPPVHYILWTVQWLLAFVFLFAGIAKMVMSVEQMTEQVKFPGLLLRFVAVAEVCGAAGMILPGLLRIRTGLTTLAACGLIIIMIGATVVVATTISPAQAIIPLIVGLLAAFVAYGRLRLAPLPARKN